MAAKADKVGILLAPGAGAPSSSPWMQRWRERLDEIGNVRCLDYPYQLAGRRSPDRQPVLVAAHRAAYQSFREEAQTEQAQTIVLVGKSMGGRIGCHVAVEGTEQGSGPAALVCLGYPLGGRNGALRDEVLLQLRTPILFVQGTRDPL